MPVSCLGNIKKQFRKSYFLFGYKRWDVFCRSTWNIPHMLFVLYRVVAAGWTTVGMALSGSIFFKDEYPVVLYLTYWCLTALCVHLCLSAVNAIIMAPWENIFSKPGPLILGMKKEDPLDEFDAGGADPECHTTAINVNNGDKQEVRHERQLMRPKPRNQHYRDKNKRRSLMGNRRSFMTRRFSVRTAKLKGGDETPLSSLVLPIRLSIQLDWLFFCVACPYGITVTLIYFGAMYPTVSKEKNLTMVEYDNFHVHGLNSIIILLEYVLGAYPVRLLHIIYPIIFGVIYLVVTVFYWLHDPVHHVLYRGVIDWNQPGRTLGYISVLAVFCIPLIHLLLFGIYRLRLYLCYVWIKHCNKETLEDEDLNDQQGSLEAVT